jgi:DNA polymerase III epsilon subunit-like protein
VGHYSLEEVSHACRVTVHDRHTARGDAVATGLVFAYLAGQLSRAGTTVAELAARQHEVGYC